jgi:arsenite methyltransferase
MTKLEFDDEFSQLMEEFNASAGAVHRRAQITDALEMTQGMRVLDVGSGPGHLIHEIAQAVGSEGLAEGVDFDEKSVEIGKRRCSGLSNAVFRTGDAYHLPFEDKLFDAVMSSQVFEYLDDVPMALKEMFRVLKPGGKALIHGTGWGALLWHSSDPDRMENVLDVWDGHLADPRMCETMGKKLSDSGFENITAEPIVHVEMSYEPNSMSAIMIKFITGYVVSQGVSQTVADEWANELRGRTNVGEYFFSSNEYIYTAEKP